VDMQGLDHRCRYGQAIEGWSSVVNNVLGQSDNWSGATGLPKELGSEGTSRTLRPALLSVLEARYDS
jgi:hypothetical protein